MVFSKVNKKSSLYFLFQLLGWGTYVLIVGYSLSKKNTTDLSLLMFLLSVFVFNVFQSHFYRIVIKKYNWVASTIVMLLLKLFVSSFVLGILFSITTNFLSSFFTSIYDGLIDFNSFLIGFVLYAVWSILYFVFAYFVRFKSQELKNLKLQSLKNEIELQNLRSQLNPHFMFNAMNSIRALVDEDPKQSKKAITQLSNILRNALIHSKDKVIPLKEELAIVDDYLGLEKIRYEERLEVVKNISDNSLVCKIPPLLLQTLVENGIKHGIAKLIKGGVIEISTKVKNGFLEIILVNSGVFDSFNKTQTGVGIINTKKRLNLEYGGRANFSIKNITDNRVQTIVTIPL